MPSLFIPCSVRTLYHYPLHPACRQVRLAYGEKKLKLRETVVDPWAPESDFLALSAEGIPPVLVDVVPGGTVTLVGARAICEYAHEASSRNPLLPDDRVERAEVRRLCDWFDTRFAEEVDAAILSERLETAAAGGTPDTETLRAGRAALADHMSYMSWLLEQRDWLGGRRYSLADIYAASHLSCLDFLGEVPWRDWPSVKAWYQTIKSRPAFRPLLDDRIPGLRAARQYRDLDF